MLNVLLHSLSFIYSFLTDLKIVNANIKKKKKIKKEKKVLLACKRPVKVDYGFPSSLCPNQVTAIPLGFYILV